MRLSFAASAAAVVAIAIAACSGPQQSVYTAPPANAAPTSGALALSGYGQTQSAGTAGGVTGTLTYVGGSGSVTAASSATAPTGTTTVSPVDRIRVEASTSPTSPNVYYVTISSTAGATLTGLPQVNLILTTAAIGTYQEAQFGNGTWTNVVGATAVPNAAGTAITFPAGTKPVTIPAGGSIFLAFYQGTFPQPTPVGQVANNVLADPGFESPASAAPIGSTINSTGWTQCSFMTLAPGATTPSLAIGTFTPEPISSTTPGPAAVILPAGTNLPEGTATPVPTLTSVVAASGSNAAVFGGVFSNRQYEDYRYNGLCQTVTVPNNPGMTMSLLANGNDGTSFFDFVVIALNTSGQYINTIYTDPNPIGSPSASSPGDSTYRSVTVPQSALTPYVGQTIQLFVGVWIDAGSSSSSTLFSGYYLLDNLNLTGTP